MFYFRVVGREKASQRACIFSRKVGVHGNRPLPIDTQTELLRITVSLPSLLFDPVLLRITISLPSFPFDPIQLRITVSLPSWRRIWYS
jgi:hypothetical protein